MSAPFYLLSGWHSFCALLLCTLPSFQRSHLGHSMPVIWSHCFYSLRIERGQVNPSRWVEKWNTQTAIATCSYREWLLHAMALEFISTLGSSINWSSPDEDNLSYISNTYEAVPSVERNNNICNHILFKNKLSYIWYVYIFEGLSVYAN